MTNIFDQLTDLAARASAGGEVFEDAVSIGTTARTNADLYRLALGELASTITARYGDANVARFAQAVGYEPRTVREWRQVRPETYPALAYTPSAELTARMMAAISEEWTVVE